MRKQFIAFFISIVLVIPACAQEQKSSPSRSTDEGGTIAVDVWSKATDSDTDKLSPEFAPAALSAAFKMESTERRIETSIKRGFPLGGFWIQNDLAEIDDSLALASASASNDADRQALRQLENQSNRLRLWSDWLIDENENLRTAEYYINSSTIDNDERFQSAVACTRFLVSMLASKTLTENDSCL